MGSCLCSGIKSQAALRKVQQCTCLDEFKTFVVLTLVEVNPVFARNSGNDRSSVKVLSLAVPPDPHIKGEILQSPNLKMFCYSELKRATRDFSRGYFLGEGNFGFVFKAWINEHSLEAAIPETGMPVAVKKLNQKGCQGQQEWLAEIKYLGQLCHPNLVKLIGYCLEDDQRLLIYEFIPKGSLEKYIFERSSRIQLLSWNLRMKVALGAAKGLKFLHDENYNAKLSDFGLARDGPIDGETHVSTRVLGSEGYAAPEYIATGHLTPKNDVYSFGVVFLEMLSGRRAINKTRLSGEQILVEWAKPYLISRRNVFRVLDARMEGHYTIGAVRKAFDLALLCLSTEPKLRPNMEEVVKALEQLYDSNDNGVLQG
ncbi:receptor-like cytoplasmic kinase 176 isoform X2 [Hevea brasiliensis]|uniref:receptor-like cytoplasmic kinase 176 isoform X2 n=1 Tax=Hevea brasiliensis TaxID=3981 RepID=UPI0025E8F45F|nr:receptor-like cytoplasmic kinase 176 isoform X2 [Hevea brasiliensis]